MKLIHMRWLLLTRLSERRKLMLLLLVGTAGCAYAVMAMIASLESKIAAVQRQIAVPSALSLLDGRKEATIPPSLFLKQFIATLPLPDTSASCLGQLHKLAEQHELQAEQGEYQLDFEKAGRLGYYRISLPVKGTYAHVRQFIAVALQDMPSLALDGVVFTRAKADIPIVEAQLRFTYMVARSDVQP